MNDVKCHLCDGSNFHIVEFRNTKTNKILLGKEQISIICLDCGLVVYTMDGRLYKCGFKGEKG